MSICIFRFAASECRYFQSPAAALAAIRNDPAVVDHCTVIVNGRVVPVSVLMELARQERLPV